MGVTLFRRLRDDKRRPLLLRVVRIFRFLLLLRRHFERKAVKGQRTLAPQTKKALEKEAAAVEINRLSLLSTENASSHVRRLTEVLRVE